MLNSKKKHIIWIDYAKVFGIFLVVYGHGNFCGDLFNYIYSFHMPMFFIICGVLYKPVSLVQTLKKGWISLMRPYIILNIICWTPFLIVKFLDDSLTMQYVFSKLGGVLLGLGYEKNGFSPISSPCWFIYTLFLMKVILAVIPNHRSGTLLCVIGVSMLLTCCFQIANIDTLIPVDSALLALPFMCCGYMYKEFITLKMFKTIPKVLLLLAFLFFCYSVDYNGMVGINRCFIGHSLILFYLNATIASVIFFSLCNAFSSMLFRLKYSIGIDLTGGGKNNCKYYNYIYSI